MDTNATANAMSEKPRNGLAGLKHWRHDLLAGLLVSLISVPFSLGIAISSGAPPVSGLVSAIIAGMVLPFLGGSYVTISGPAAGLAPALLAAMLLLGRGDTHVGYPLLLGAICITGAVQIVLAKYPGFSPAQQNLLDIYDRLGFGTEALELLDQMIQAEPENVSLLRRRRDWLDAQRRFVPALERRRRNARRSGNILSKQRAHRRAGREKSRGPRHRTAPRRMPSTASCLPRRTQIRPRAG